MISIQQANPKQYTILTEISFQSKNYWNYPKDWMDIWKKELTITPEYIKKNQVFIALLNDHIVGYYSLVHNTTERWIGSFFFQQAYWLDHMFVHPDHIGQGIGTAFMKHLTTICQETQVQLIRLLADPHSIGFYKKMGCNYIHDVPSNISGRTVSLFEFVIPNI